MDNEDDGTTPGGPIQTKGGKMPRMPSPGKQTK